MPLAATVQGVRRQIEFNIYRGQSDLFLRRLNDDIGISVEITSLRLTPLITYGDIIALGCIDLGFIKERQTSNKYTQIINANLRIELFFNTG